MNSLSIIKINTDCNNNCIFCHSKSKKNIKSGSFVNTINKIDILKKNNIKTIYLSGGEPTLNKDLNKIIKLIKKNEMNFGLITNSRFFSNKSVLDYFIKNDIKYVHTSLLGSNEKINDAITRTPGSFKQTIQGIKNLINKDILVDANCVIIKQNINDLENIANLAKKLKINSIRFSFVEPLSIKNDYIPNITNSFNEVKKIIEKFQNQDFKIIFDNFPMCISKEMEKHRENLLSKNIIYISEYYEKELYFSDQGNKIKTTKCNNCKKIKECEGIFEKYINIHGDKDLKPFI